MIIPHFRSIETPRLILRRFRVEDLEPFMAYRNDPEVARYQTWESFSREEAEKFIARQSRARPGIPGRWFQFAVEIKDRGVLAGDCALLMVKWARKIGEIGYTFSREYQGVGFATEAAGAVVDYGFDTIGLNRIIATTDCRNTRSVALMKRLGMRQEAHFIQNIWFKGSWCDEYHYAMLRAEWNAAREGSGVKDRA